VEVEMEVVAARSGSGSGSVVFIFQQHLAKNPNHNYVPSCPKSRPTVNKDDIGKGIQHVLTLKSQRLLEILVYHSKMNKTEMTKLKLNERREKMKELWPSVITRSS
jgi:hypothetical protein